MASTNARLWLRTKKMDHTETDTRMKHHVRVVESHNRPFKQARALRPEDNPNDRGLTTETLLD